jgi:hypothetical protein
VGEGSQWVSAADVDRDGKPDVIVAQRVFRLDRRRGTVTQ